MKTKKAREEQRKLKQLKHAQDIAEAFLKARSTYPSAAERFEEMAGEREVKVFYSTMYLCKKSAEKHGFSFDYFYSELCGEWLYYFIDECGRALKVIERECGLELVCIG